MIYKIDILLEKYLPSFIYKSIINAFRFIFYSYPVDFIRNYIFFRKLNKTISNHKKCVKVLKQKKQLNIVFLLVYESVWKYEELYKLMEKSSLYNPVIIVCPNIVFGVEAMFYELDKTYTNFKEKGFNVVSSFDNEKKLWIDVKEEFKPDIVFFTSPHNLTKPQYCINNFLDTLTCYVPYGIMTPSSQDAQFDKDFHNYLWKGFYETEIHKNMAKKYARNKGQNIIVTGYPIFDDFIAHEKEQTNDVWKIKNRTIRRIIWAPHHTLDLFREKHSYATFLEYCDFMLQMAEKYKDKIQIAFKPHPGLRPKLSKENVWGLEKTDAYYAQWEGLNNGQVEEGAYIDLFLNSDAMILDSISFFVEYMYTGKPLMFLVKNDAIPKMFNEFGQIAFEHLYKGYSGNDIERFINDIVLENNDILYKERGEFINRYFDFSGKQSVSEKILEIIERSIYN